MAFLTLIPILSLAQVQVPDGCGNPSAYLYRGDLGSKMVGARTWHLDRITSDLRKNPSDNCLSSLKEQASKDASEYWQWIRSRCESGAKNLDCSKVDENLAYVHLVAHGNKVNPNDTCITRRPVGKTITDVAAIIEQIPPRADDRNCPTHLIEQRKSDRSSFSSAGLRVASSKDCLEIPATALGNNLFNAESFEKYISESSQFSSLKNSFLTSKSCAQYMDGLSEAEKIGVVSDYYYYSNHLKASELALINSIALADRLNGDSNFPEDPICGSSRQLEPRRMCEALKSCSSGSAEMDQYVSRAQNDLRELQAIEDNKNAELAKLPIVKAQIGDRGFEPKFVESQSRTEAIIRKAEALKSVVYQKNSILKNPQFKDHKASLLQTKEHLKEAMKASRPALLKKLNEARGYQDCLDKNNCSIDRLNRFLATMPLKLPTGQESGAKDIKKSMTMDLLASSQHCQEMRGLNAKVGEAALDVTLNVGLGLVSGGLGLAARGARLARTTKLLNGVSTLGDSGVLARTSTQAWDSCMNSNVQGSVDAYSNKANCGGSAEHSQWQRDSQCTTQLLTAALQVGMLAQYGLRPSIRKPDEILPSESLIKRPPNKNPSGEVIDVEPRPPAPRMPRQLASGSITNAEVKNRFKGVKGIVVETEYTRNAVGVTMAPGTRPLFYQSREMRQIAVQEGRIYEGVSLADLPKNETYTYVVLEDGTRVYGRSDSTIELGTKHYQLADGRKVVAAGEVYTGINGVEYNLLSGSFMSDVAIKEPETFLRIQREMEYIFSKEAPGAQYADINLIKAANGNASRQYFRKYCDHPLFAKENEHICRDPKVKNYNAPQ